VLNIKLISNISMLKINTVVEFIVIVVDNFCLTLRLVGANSMRFNNIIEAIGKTPLVRLNRIGSQLECNLYAKCEFLNPGGSVKDRIGRQMVEDAEKSGRIKPGDTLIEPTSGNTGIGLALAGAVKGYNVIITMPEKMSREKQVVLEALGAKIIRTPTEAPSEAPESHIGVAKKLQRELPNAHILDQYANPSNPTAHYEGTAQEILDDLSGKVDMVVIAAGTGGTITGVAKKIKEVNPKCIVVGADPIGSILAGGTHIASYKVEGIGYDFIPDVLNRSLIDTWVKTNDRQSFLLARELIAKEGLLCGGSSGSSLFAALQEAKKLKKGQNCVVLLADGVRNYMTKFVDNRWMEDNRFTSIESLNGTVGQLLARKKSGAVVCIESKSPLVKAIEILRNKGYSQAPVVADGKLVGMLRESDILKHLLSGSESRETPVANIMCRNVPNVDMETPLSALQELLLDTGSVVVTDTQRVPQQIVTKIDLVEWLCEA
jgi:cystathionine beta-synthase